jgi:hypothetical protein
MLVGERDVHSSWRAGDMAQWLLGKHEALSSNPSPTKHKKKGYLGMCQHQICHWVLSFMLFGCACIISWVLPHSKCEAWSINPRTTKKKKATQRLGRRVFQTIDLTCRHSTTWATLPVHFILVILELGVLWPVCPDWPRTSILLISASQVTKITGVSHWHPARQFSCVCVPGSVPGIGLTVQREWQTCYEPMLLFQCHTKDLDRLLGVHRSLSCLGWGRSR